MYIRRSIPRSPAPPGPERSPEKEGKRLNRPRERAHLPVASLACSYLEGTGERFVSFQQIIWLVRSWLRRAGSWGRALSFLAREAVFNVFRPSRSPWPGPCTVAFQHWKKNFFLFFLFFLFTFFTSILQSIWSEKILQNYTSSAMWDGGRDLQPCPTTVGGAWYCRTFLPPCPTTVGSSLFSKNCNFLFELGWR
jgi:hypothetical protein